MDNNLAVLDPKKLSAAIAKAASFIQAKTPPKTADRYRPRLRAGRPGKPRRRGGAHPPLCQYPQLSGCHYCRPPRPINHRAVGRTRGSCYAGGARPLLRRIQYQYNDFSH